MNIDSFFTFIKENFTPNGIVFSTEKAKKIIGKNNLTPAEFLRPFGLFPKVIFNTEISSTTITDFRLDFYDSEYYRKIPYNDYSKILEKVLSSKNITPEIPNLCFNNYSEEKNKNLSDKIIEKLSGFSFSWFNIYIKTICELIKFNECELYQQPLCFIYFCSIDDNLDIIKPQLNEREKIPSLIYERIYDPDMPILIIIINDKMDEKPITLEEKNKYIEEFKKRYKVYYLLYWELNEISNQGNNELNENIIKYYSGDLWSKYEHVVEKYYYNNNEDNSNDIDIKGKYININSRRRFHQTINDFFVKYAVKHIEHKIRTIEKKILETKIGIKNTIFSFFKQDNSNESLSYNNFFKIYSLSQNEFNEYFFATICFFFRNYKQAKEVSSIFMNDIKKKSTRHYNAGFELNKLSYFLNNYINKNKGLEYNPFYKDDDAFESFSNYIKNENYFQACRALFSGIKIHEQNITILQLASILSDVITFIPGLPNKNGSVYVNYFYPLINEQISAYYVVLEPIKKRKFVLFMVQAAIRFRKESKLNSFLTNYSLNDFLFLIDFLEKNNENSFLISKNFISEQLAIIFQEKKNKEGAIIFYMKNIENFIHFPEKEKNTLETNAYKIFANIINLLDLINKEKQNENILKNNNFFNKFSFPSIDNSSILIIEEQDIIINNSYKNENKSKIKWKYFNKYDYIPVQKKFLCLTPPDIRALINLDNIIHNKQNFSNFFSKRKFHINLNKKIFVSFSITNPLPFDISINSMKLICEFISEKDLLNDLDSERTNDTLNDKNFNEENELIYEEKKIIIKRETSNIIELYIQGNKEGRIIIKGVEMLIENYIVVKHYFNKKNKSNLYSYVKKRKRASLSSGLSANVDLLGNNDNNKWKRKGSNNSENSNKSKGSNNSYNFHYKYKEEIICDIKDDNNDINITFPLGNEIKLYKNELFLMPIKIVNNSNINIKNFCFYFNDDSNDIRESCLLSELIFKEFEITNDKQNKNNENIIYVPIIPKKKGKIFVKILFKFEEDKTYIDHEIQRYLITFDVKDSFSVNFKETIIKSSQDIITADIDMVSIVHNYNNSSSLKSISINPIIYTNKSFEQNNNFITNSNENLLINEEHKVIYKKYRIKKLINEEDRKNSINYLNKQSEYAIKKRKEKLNRKIKELEKHTHLHFLNKYEFLKNNNNNVDQSHIKNNFCNLLAKDYLVINWSGIEKDSNKEINGILLYKPKFQFSFYNNNLFKNIINNFISMKHNIIKMNNNSSLCIITVLIDNNFCKALQKIKGIEIYIKNTDKNNFKAVKWIGLTNYYLSNIEPNSNKKDEIQFTCIINEKGIYDINKIGLVIHYIISRNRIQKIDNILSPIIVKID